MLLKTETGTFQSAAYTLNPASHIPTKLKYLIMYYWRDPV